MTAFIRHLAGDILFGEPGSRPVFLVDHQIEQMENLLLDNQDTPGACGLYFQLQDAKHDRRRWRIASGPVDPLPSNQIGG